MADIGTKYKIYKIWKVLNKVYFLWAIVFAMREKRKERARDRHRTIARNWSKVEQQTVLQKY